MKMRIFALLFLALMIPQLTSAQATPEEEHVIQRAYARLSMATEVKGVEDSQATNQDQLNTELAGKVLQFQITSLSGGPTSEILDTPVVSLVSLTGDVLDVSTGETVNTNAITKTQVREPGANAHWVKSHDAFDQRSPLTFKEALSETGLPSANRYVQVSLIVTLAGRSRTYNSLFLFDAKGNASALDPVVGSSAVNHFVLRPVYPHMLMETDYYSSRAVTRVWLAAKQVLNCSSVEKSECCDLPAVRCGISQADLASLNAKPVSAASAAKLTVTPNDGIPGEGGPNATNCPASNFNYPLTPYNASDTNQHIDGNHSMVGDSYGTCTYANPPNGALCLTHATASITANMGESGSVTTPFSWHITGSSYTNSTADSIGGVATPTAIAAGAVQSCVAGLCTVTVGISGPGGSISFPATSVWTHSENYQATCGAVYGTAPPPGGGGPPVCIGDGCGGGGDKPLVVPKPITVPAEPLHRTD